MIEKFGILCGNLFISLFLLSCKKSINVSLEISTSGCYKTCPILDVKLDNNVIYYNFLKYNKLKGVYYYKLNDDEKRKINSLISFIELDSLKKEYISYISDVQIYNTKLKYKGKTKEVFFFKEKAPKEYQNLINYILDFKNKPKIKIDTVLNILTRDKVKLIEVIPPPMPNK